MSDARQTPVTPIVSDAEHKIRGVEQQIVAALTAPQDDLRTIALLTAKVKELTAENAALKEKVVAAQGERDIFMGMAAREREIGDDWKKAALSRKDALGSGDAIIEQYKAQLARADVQIDKQAAEINRLRNPSLFQSLFNTDTILKVGGGMAAGLAICGR